MQTLRHARVWVALGCTLGWAPVGAQDLPAEVAQALARAGVPESSVAMVVAGRAEDLKSGAELAAAVIDDGRAATALAELVRVSHAPIEDEDA